MRTQILIDRGWEIAIKKINGKKWNCFDGDLYQFEKIKVYDNTITILASLANKYSNVVGLRALNANDIKFLTNNEKPNALSVITIPVTKDNYCLLRWRNSGDWDESYELPGGFIRPQDKNVLDCAYDILNNELGISDEKISCSKILGVFGFPSIFETMTIILFKININSYEIAKKISPLIMSLSFSDMSIFSTITKSGLLHLIHRPSLTIISSISLDNFFY